MRKAHGNKGRRHGPIRKIVGEELLRTSPDSEAHLHEVLACGHRQRGVYNKDGDSCDAGGNVVHGRRCRQCLEARKGA